MATKKSAGILVYRKVKMHVQVFLVHPGGPFWQNKNEGAWSIPKGEFTETEDPLAAAQREFREETGVTLVGDFTELFPIRQKSGKWVYAWAIEADIDADNIISNEFEIEWPPKSGKMKSIPEVDKAAWFNTEEAKQKINPGQAPLISELLDKLA